MVELVEVRHYSAIWRQLKHKDRCILYFKQEDLRKYKKAVSKEKIRDKVWNKSNSARLCFQETTDREGKYIVVITLQKYWKLSRLGAAL